MVGRKLPNRERYYAICIRGRVRGVHIWYYSQSSTVIVRTDAGVEDRDYEAVGRYDATARTRVQYRCRIGAWVPRVKGDPGSLRSSIYCEVGRQVICVTSE